jgi:hypothetical protein
MFLSHKMCDGTIKGLDVMTAYVRFTGLKSAFNVRFIGSENSFGLISGESYLIRVNGMTIMGRSSEGVFTIEYESIQKFLEDWSFIDINFMSSLDE